MRNSHLILFVLYTAAKEKTVFSLFSPFKKLLAAIIYVLLRTKDRSESVEVTDHDVEGALRYDTKSGCVIQTNNPK